MTVLILIKESEIDTGALARWRAYEEVAPRPGCIQFAFIRAPDNGSSDSSISRRTRLLILGDDRER